MSSKEYFRQLARYNQWANERLYADAASLPDEASRREIGLYFGSLFATLRHLVRTDRAWMCLLEGGDLKALETPTMDSFAELRSVRIAEDARQVEWIGAMDEADFDTPFGYTPWAGDFKDRSYREKRRDVLAHFFNHQTHHRGQAHAALTILGLKEPRPLDLFAMQILGEK
jgi:uncharacterized damage-inducible protein DinB